MSDDVSRRGLLTTVGVGALAGLAGCSEIPGSTTANATVTTTERDGKPADGDDPCPAVEHVLNSGYDQEDESLIADGETDDDWDVTADGKNGAGSVPRDADVVSDTDWPDPFDDSRWISIDQNKGQPLPQPDTQFEYTYCFCLNEGFRKPKLELAIQADDEVEDVRLNGHSLAYSGDGQFQGDPIEETYTNRRYFQAGENCLTIQVADTQRVITGLNVAGTVKAKNADCDCGCGDCDLSVEKTHEGQFGFGETGTYAIEVCNAGDGTCDRAAVVRDEFPDGVTFQGASGTGWEVVGTNNGVTTFLHQNPGGLAPGECLPALEVEVEVNPADEFGDHEVLRNCAYLQSGSDGDGDNDENCDEIDCLEGQITIPGGVDDEYAGDTEPTSPSKGLQNAKDLPLREFDEGGINKVFAHTFEVPEPPLAGEICDAELSFRVRPEGAGDFNDRILLGRWHDDGSRDDDYFWGQSLGERSTPGLFDTRWTTSETGARETTLDIADLPNNDGSSTDLLAELRQHGTLDVMIQDDTAVDYMDLTVTYCCGDDQGGHGECDLSIQKTAKGEFNFGEVGTYVVQVCNDGDGACEAGPLRVIDELPDAVRYVDASGTGWTVSENGGTVTAEHPAAGGLAPGDCLPPLVIEVEVYPEDRWPHDEHVLRNCAELHLPDLGAVDTDCVSTEVTGDGGGDDGECKPTIEKTAIGDFAYGGHGMYEIQVCNAGDGACEGTFEVTDKLPAGLTVAAVDDNGWDVDVADDGSAFTAVYDATAGLAPGDCLPAIQFEVDIVGADEWPHDSDEVTNCAQLSTDSGFVMEDCATKVVT